LISRLIINVLNNIFPLIQTDLSDAFLHRYIQAGILGPGSKFRIMSRTAERESRHRHQPGMVLIPAGALIGLGIGLLTGHTGAGVLIGLGAGFIGAALLKAFSAGNMEESEAGGQVAGSVFSSLIMVCVGLFLVLLGLGITFPFQMFWPIIGGVVLIMLGIWLVYRNFYRSR
jgi:hypothetical protein